jgi:hypothetical protein
VPLRDVSALDEWREGAGPSSTNSAIVEAWVLGLDAAPWLFPSTPFPELSFQPDFETRSAEVPDSGGIEVFYRHEYATGEVDLIWVGRT